MSKPVEFRLILLLEVNAVEHVPDRLTVLGEILNLLLTMILLRIKSHLSKDQFRDILFFVSLVNYWELNNCDDMSVGGLLVGKGSAENRPGLLLILYLECRAIQQREFVALSLDWDSLLRVVQVKGVIHLRIGHTNYAKCHINLQEPFFTFPQLKNLRNATPNQPLITLKKLSKLTIRRPHRQYQRVSGLIETVENELLCSWEHLSLRLFASLLYKIIVMRYLLLLQIHSALELMYNCGQMFFADGLGPDPAHRGQCLHWDRFLKVSNLVLPFLVEQVLILLDCELKLLLSLLLTFCFISHLFQLLCFER